MDAKYLSHVAKNACRALHFTPRQFQVLNADKETFADGPATAEYPVLRIWNARREIVLTNHDMAYALAYLD